MTRLFGPDPIRLRLRLIAVELLASAGVAASVYLAGLLLPKEATK